MGVGRITQGILTDRALNDLQDQLSRILDLQIQLSTGQRVNRPSDDPLATLRAVRARTEIGKNDQFLANISNTRPFVRETETALTQSLDFTRRAYELALQGASGTNAQEELDAIAQEVDQVLEGVLRLANSQSGNRFLFGGTRTSQEPFTATRDANGEITAVTYIGNDQRIGLQIDELNNVDVNVTGEEAFDVTFPGTVDVFQALVDLRDNLRAGDQAALQNRIGELLAAQDQLLFNQSRIGALDNRLDAEIENIEVQLQSQRENLSDNIDVDFAEVVLDLEASQNAFEAALSASARVIQPSLLQFLG